ncbi:MAG TPA: hypothetical protein VF753_02035 [Terriglobales bacterium]
MMEKTQPRPASHDQTWILSALEHDQLVKAKKHQIPRRKLNGFSLAVITALRIYVLLMMAVIIYQIWIATR